MLPTDPNPQINAQLVPLAETSDTRLPVIRNLTGGPPTPKPRSPSTWSSRSSSDWEVLSEGRSPLGSVFKVIADFDENDQEWYPSAVRVPAGTQVQLINKNYDATYSQVQINNEKTFIPKRLLQFVTQPFVTSTFCPSPLSSINQDNS